MDIPNRPDFSEYVAHFTKSGAPDVDSANALGIPPRAFDRLVKMLGEGNIIASTMKHSRKAVALTECTWASFPDHAEHYSPYAIGFTKKHVYRAGGGPAFYMRPELFEKQLEFRDENHKDRHGFHSHVYAFITTFCPEYATDEQKQRYSKYADMDYSYEREWRVPHDFKFDYRRAAFIVVKTQDDVEELLCQTKLKIDRNKFLVMDMYRRIEELWPTHRLTEPQTGA